METKVLTADDLRQAALLIKRGEVVAFPTETVYGLGASIFQPLAIASIFSIKGRPSDNPLIAHVSSFDQLHQIAEKIPPSFYKLVERFWPGPLTCVLRKTSSVPSLVSAGLDSIAVRMPSHQIALDLITLVGEPLVAPSANLSGRPSPTTSHHVLQDLRGKIPAVIEGGNSLFGIESTVVSLLEEVPILLRPGSISIQELSDCLGVEVVEVISGHPVVSPGMKYRHYAPYCPITLVTDLAQFTSHIREKGDCKRMVLSSSCIDTVAGNSFPLISSNLYALLRKADEEEYEEIVVVCDPALRQEMALMNRLLKAAAKTS